MYYDTLDDLFDVADFTVTRTDRGTTLITGSNRRTSLEFSVEDDLRAEAISRAVDDVMHDTWLVEEILADYNISLDTLRSLVGVHAEEREDWWLDDDIDVLQNLSWEDGYEAGRMDERLLAEEYGTWPDLDVDAEVRAANEYSAWLAQQGINAMPISVAAAQSLDTWEEDDWYTAPLAY